jgi:hypothetical protein
MLRHLVRQGFAVAWPQLCAAGDRLPEIDCRRVIDGRQPAPECRAELSSPKASRPRKTIIAVLVGNLCGDNRGAQAVERSTRRGSAVLRHKAKYEEQVVYARARPGVMRRYLPAVTSGAYGEYSYNCVVVRILRRIFPLWWQLHPGADTIASNGPRPPRNSAGVGRHCSDGDGPSWSQREGRLRVGLFKEEKP